MYKILIIEDDAGLVEGLSYAIERVGYEATAARSRAEMQAAR